VSIWPSCQHERKGVARSSTSHQWGNVIVIQWPSRQKLTRGLSLLLRRGGRAVEGGGLENDGRHRAKVNQLGGVPERWHCREPGSTKLRAHWHTNWHLRGHEEDSVVTGGFSLWLPPVSAHHVVPRAILGGSTRQSDRRGMHQVAPSCTNSRNSARSRCLGCTWLQVIAPGMGNQEWASNPRNLFQSLLNKSSDILKELKVSRLAKVAVDHKSPVATKHRSSRFIFEL